jgi:reversibly glycosylated polypeptide/UDP-arabinopyranose mutase
MTNVADVVIVVPTIREASITTFLRAWQWPCPVIVIEDNPERTFRLPPGIDHYAWADIEADLGDKAWIIPRRTDCIRSYGYWKAWQTGKPYIITLDDDCLPEFDFAPSFLQSHIDNLQPQTRSRWYNTLRGVYPRGYPYAQTDSVTPVGISHGLWRGVLDLDSIAQLHYDRAGDLEAQYPQALVPPGMYFPMCGMNLAWRRAYTPLMYFLLMGQDAEGLKFPYDRFGDIWCGIIAKKILDHLGVGVRSGDPFVRHDRASNVWANFAKEHAGIVQNETFWKAIDAIELTALSAINCYQQIADALVRMGGYEGVLGKAMNIWSDLYE